MESRDTLMTRSILKATTALSVSLSLLQPGALAAQGFVGTLRPTACVDATGVCTDLLWRVQTCAEDRTLPECPVEVPAPAVVPEIVPEVTPEVVPEVIPEETPEADPEAVPEAVPEGTPEAIPEIAPEPAPEAVAPAAVVPEAAPEAAAPEAAAPEAVAPEPAPEAVAPEVVVPEAAPEAAAAEAEAAPAPPVEEAPAAPAPDAAQAAPETESAPVVEPEATVPDAPAAEAVEAPAGEGAGTAAPADPAVAPEAPATVEPTPAPVADPQPAPTPEQEAVLETMMADPDVAAAVDTLSQATTPAPAAATASETAPAAAGNAATALDAILSGGAVPAAADTTTQTLGADQARNSTQDFATTLNTAAPTEAPKKDKLSDLEKAGLLALGAVAVGMLINNNRVVANSGDRVVVDRGDGDLAIWKDDNANLRAPGVVETTQRYNDGSTLTTLERPDGTQIVTVRDATGRVLRRDRVNRDGRRVQIIDDTQYYRPVVVSDLPRPRVRELRFVDDSDPVLVRALLDDAEDADLGRNFSLAQVRDIRELRDLAPELTARPITFATGSSAIRPEEAAKLSRIAALMNDLIDDNPRELFLIEGHTDAVGGAASNLALSDRRAESVALALTEIFGVPAENMVVQGYGERYLKVATTVDEPANRRVALRRVTWLVNES